MIILSLIILILITALPSFFKIFPENCYNRISAIVLLFCAILTFNTLDLESIGSGIAIYGGLFHITIITQFMDIVLYIIASFNFIITYYSCYLLPSVATYLISFVLSFFIMLMFYLKSYKIFNKLF